MSTDSSSSQPPLDLMEALLRDPAKKRFLLNLLAKQNDAFEAHRRKETPQPATPINKVKIHCESPTALQRRRALAKLNQTSSDSSSSEQSEVLGPKLPFDQLLKGVKAYVEVRRDNCDRSEGIKAVMRLMGATVRDQFGIDITHVVFKDGSYSTYRKAKLLKVHLVSVLWLDAVRRHEARVPEKNYPAFGESVCDKQVSILCSQLQKEYDDVVKDERRRSPSVPSAHHSKQSRRFTINPTSQTSIGRPEVPQTSQLRSTSPELTSDDSECAVVDGYTSRPSKNYMDLLCVSPAITDDGDEVIEDSLLNSKLDASSESTNSKSLLGGRRNTNCLVTSMEITPGTNSKDDGDRRSLRSDPMSSLRVSTDSDRTKSGLGNSKGSNKENSVGTTMSSLRVSDCSNKEKEVFTDNTNESRGRKSSSVKNPLKDKSSAGLSVTPEKSVESFSRLSSEAPRVLVTSVTKPESRTQRSNSSSENRNEPDSQVRTLSSSCASKNSRPMGSETKNALETSVEIEAQEQVKGPGVETENPKRAKNQKSIGRVVASSDGSSCTSDQVVSVQSSEEASRSNRRRSAKKTKDQKNNKSPRDQNIPLASSDSEEVSNRSDKRPHGPNSDDSSDGASTSEYLSNRDKNKQSSEALQRLDTNRYSISRSSRLVSKDKAASPAPLNTKTKNLRSTSNSSESSVRPPSTNRNDCDAPLRTDSPIHASKNTKSMRSESKKDHKTSAEHVKGQEAETGRVKKRGRHVVFSSDSSSCATDQNISVASSEEEASIINRRISARKTKDQKRNNGLKDQHIPAEEVSHRSCVPSDDVTDDGSASRSSSKVRPTPSPLKKSRLQIPKSNSRRKLYTPGDILITPSQDYLEREERKQKSQRLKVISSQECSKEVFLDPNEVHIQPVRRTLILEEPAEVEEEEVLEEEVLEVVPKKTTKRNQKKPKTPRRRSSADEQKGLLEMLTEKVDEPLRRSRRISLSQTTPTESFPFTPIKRRSTLDFVSVSQTQKRPRVRTDLRRKPSIVCSKFHRGEVAHFEGVVRKLGRFITEDKVTERTTHLVVGEVKRTINMLRAMARGCWIVRREWLLKSSERGKWLDEEDYEVTEFSPVVQKNRLQRQAFGSGFRMDVFKGLCVYVSKSTTPQPAELRELINVCEGRITNTYREADFVIGAYFRVAKACVTEKWLLDSITENKLKSSKRYLIKPTGPVSPTF